VVLTPRRWRQALRRLVRLNRAGQSPNPRGDGGKRARSPRRARSKPLKPLRAGMPGDSGVTAVNTRVHLPLPCAHEAAGAQGTRHSPRPSWGRRRPCRGRARSLLRREPRPMGGILATTRAHRAARGRGMFEVDRRFGASAGRNLPLRRALSSRPGCSARRCRAGSLLQSSPRKRGPIRRSLSVLARCQTVLATTKQVVMGPFVRGDDDRSAEIAPRVGNPCPLLMLDRPPNRCSA
jgi:hypothetical protein